MVRQCAVKGCKNESFGGCGISFHSFPKGELYNQWEEACGHKIIGQNAVICSEHFKKEDYMPNIFTAKLKPGAIPVYLLPNSTLRPPGTELAVPSRCISIGEERFLQIPIIASEMSNPNTIKTEPGVQMSNPNTIKTEPGVQVQEDNNVADPLSLDRMISVDRMLSVDRDQDNKQLVMTIDPMAMQDHLSDPEHNYALKPMIDEAIKEESSSDSECLDIPLDSLDQTNISSSISNYERQRILAENYKYEKLQKESRRQKNKITELQKKIKILRQKLNRIKIKKDRTKEVLNTVKHYTKCSEIDNILNGRFNDLCKLFNKNNPKTLDYSSEVIKFAVSLYCLSPKAYDLVRKYMALPHVKTVQKYISKSAYKINKDT